MPRVLSAARCTTLPPRNGLWQNLSQGLVEKERERRNQAENDREACRQKYQETENRYQQEMAIIREQQMRLLQREQNEEESLEVMKNRWEEWETNARKRLKDGEEKLQISKKELDRATQSLQKFLQEENRKKRAARRGTATV